MPVYAIVALNCSKKPFSSGLFSQVESETKKFRAFHLSAHRTRLLKNFCVYVDMDCTRILCLYCRFTISHFIVVQHAAKKRFV